MGERERAVGRDPVLLLRAHLAERPGVTVGAKDRIVAEPGRPARREDERPIDPPFERFQRPVRPGEGENADEGGAPRRRRAERALSSRSTRAIAAAKSLPPPAQRAE